MHEQAYRLLLRLYPAPFRRTHGDEALQLFLDRLRDETGFVRRVRLWLDLLVDFGAIWLHGYRELSAAAAVAGSVCGPGVPSFRSLEEERIRASSLLWGGVLSVVLCASVLFALEHGRGRLLRFQHAVSYSSPGVSKSRVRVEFTCQTLNKSKKPMVRLK